jgi:hypothetical protein
MPGKVSNVSVRVEGKSGVTDGWIFIIGKHHGVDAGK